MIAQTRYFVLERHPVQASAGAKILRARLHGMIRCVAKSSGHAGVARDAQRGSVISAGASLRWSAI